MFAKTNLPNFCSPSLPIIASNQYNGLYVPMFVFNLPLRRGFGAAAGAACLQNFVKFQKFQLENLVDFEKCCKTHIFLQKSEPIQPKTSNILQKF